MFDQIMHWLKAPEAAAEPPDDLRLSVAVLLVEAAHMDDQFGAEERAAIERLLREKFSLSEKECRDLLDISEDTVAQAVQLHPHTRTCFTGMEHEQRVHLIEMLWEVAYADGVIDPEEDMLLRRIAGLIYVSDRERIYARQRVLARGKSKGAH